MKGAIFQFEPLLGQTEKNLAKIVDVVKNVDADFIVLPELATSGYLFLSTIEVRTQALLPDDEQFGRLYDIAKRKNMMIVLGFPELDGDKVYNSSIAILPDGNFHVYRKTHLFYKEKEAFLPGDTGFFVFDFRGVKFGMMVCFDWFFPESARVLAKKGAQVLLHVSNLVLPGLAQKGMIVRSLENRVFSFTANRIGTEEREGISLRFTGMSQVVSPRGDVIKRASEDLEEILIVDFDPEEAVDKNITELNHIFRDRRPSFYDELCD